MSVSQQQLALQMIAQLRLLDPSVSAEVGSPERKIIDTVAQGLFDSQIDLAALASALDVDSKYGAQLDRFLALFGFGRQKATYASGFVTFSRVTASSMDIRIPSGSIVQAPGTATDFVTGDTNNAVMDVRFTTTFDVILPAGDLSVVAPVRANVAGELGNVAANRITEIVGTPIYGITSVTNELPTAFGNDAESDEEFKVRFKNTVFRNLAGTRDQYLALSIATAFTSKANVIGPQSYYREYVQVPPVADNAAYDADGDLDTEGGNGSAGEYTTALSTIPHAKYIYAEEFPAFLSNGKSGLEGIFFRPDIDFRINWPDDVSRYRGDTYRLIQNGLSIDVDSFDGQYQPNVTLLNVYTGENGDVQAIRPDDVVLFEFSYLSQASRNDFALGIDNAVDVFIDGGNETLASTITTRPNTSAAFVDDPNSKYHYENYRRYGETEKRPIIGNVLMPLFWQPVLDVPDQIIIGTSTYFNGVHYWPIYDVSLLCGSIRARSGIEWSTKIKGKLAADPLGNVSLYTGKIITDTSGDPVGGQPVEVDEYIYDRNINDLQSSFEGARQVTTDVLAHRAKQRYFKLDISVMYNQGYNVSNVNTSIQANIDSFLKSQYFGSAIQLSDLLQIIHNTSGVDNVRWSSDTPNSPDLSRVYECDINGVPLLGVTVDKFQPGTASQVEIQSLYITGQPTSGYFKLWDGFSLTSSLEYDVTAAELQTELGLSGIGPATVTEDARSTDGVRTPVRSFRIQWPSNGAKPTLEVQAGIAPLKGGPYIINSDFFLRDDELASLPTGIYVPDSGLEDTVAGLIIRPRAQNTWVRGQ